MQHAGPEGPPLPGRRTRPRHPPPPSARRRSLCRSVRLVLLGVPAPAFWLCWALPQPVAAVAILRPAR
eukprot:1605901-Lingulodinium_polyedra.AAC.1